MNTYCRSLINYELRSETRWNKKNDSAWKWVLRRLFRHQMEVNSAAATSRYHLDVELPCVHISPKAHYLCLLFVGRWESNVCFFLPKASLLLFTKRALLFSCGWFSRMQCAEASEICSVIFINLLLFSFFLLVFPLICSLFLSQTVFRIVVLGIWDYIENKVEVSSPGSH